MSQNCTDDGQCTLHAIIIEDIEPDNIHNLWLNRFWAGYLINQKMFRVKLVPHRLVSIPLGSYKVELKDHKYISAWLHISSIF